MIKKSLTIFFLALVLSNFLYSQKLEVGLKGGSNLATQKLSSIQGVESITGYHLGSFVYIKLPLIFGIQVEGQYSTQGSEFLVNQLINKNNLSYLNIPILFRNDFGPFNFHFGPQFAKKLSMDSSGIPIDRILGTSIKAANHAGKMVRDIMKRGDLGIIEKTGANDLQVDSS